MSFLFIDHILEIIEGKFIRGIKQITAEDFFIYTPVEDTAYFAPALIGETLGQLAAWNVMQTHAFKQRPVAGIVAEACLKRPVYVGETLHLEAYIDNLDEHAVTYHGTASVNAEPVFSLEGALGPLLPMSDFIEETVVRKQFEKLIPAQVSTHPVNHSEQEREMSPRLPENNKEKQKNAPWFYFDHILSHEPEQSITAEKYIDPQAPFFPDHFPKKPVWPLTILLECVLNLASKLLNKENGMITLRKIKMKEFVRPGARIISTLSVKSTTPTTTILQSHTELEGKRVCVFELVYENQP